jgi:hypothetical protein
VQDPIASCGVAGSVGRRDRSRLLGSKGCLCTYFSVVSIGCLGEGWGTYYVWVFW